MEPKFKVGDKVIVIKPTMTMSITGKGSIGTIIQIINDDILVDFESYGNGMSLDDFHTKEWQIPKNTVKLYKPKKTVSSPVEKIEAKHASIWGDW